MAALIVLAIGIVELCLQNHAAANKWGIAICWNILFLIPLLLLYHPHKGPRNVALDVSLTTLYIVAILAAYVLVLVMVGIRLF